MTEKTNLVPKRRFKEFQNTHAWEQRKLGEVAEFNPKSTLPDEFEYVDLESVVGTNLIAHRAESKESAPSRAQRLAQRGDIFYQTVRPYQKNNYLYELPYDNYVFSTGYAQIRPNIDSYFLFSRVQEELFVKAVLDRSTGTSYPAINSNDLAEIEIMIPINNDEQVKIGSLFRSLDSLITLHQRKLEKTKALKSAYLSEMFPAEGENKPKRRFAGFTQAWEQCEWKNTVDISTNMVDPKTGKYDNLPHIGPGNIESFSGRLYDNVNTVKDDNLISGKFHFNKGDIIYGKINPQLGKYVFAPFEGLASADAYVLNAKNGLDQTFLFALLQTRHFFKYSVSVSMRSGMPKINRDELNEYRFNAPSIKEQKRIGEHFLLLDNLIILHQRKLEKLQSIKKAYLNEMFV